MFKYPHTKLDAAHCDSDSCLFTNTHIHVYVYFFCFIIVVAIAKEEGGFIKHVSNLVNTHKCAP